MDNFNIIESIKKSRSGISMSLSSDLAHQQTWMQKIGLTLVGIGLLIMLLAFVGVSIPASIGLASALSLMGIGGVLYSRDQYAGRPIGIKNNGNTFAGISSRGAIAWIFTIVITGFYVLLYWYPSVLGLGKDGAANVGLIALFDPLSYFFKGKPASEWFVYGTLYTLAILVMGVKFIAKYRHNKYQIIRTLSVMFFQLGFAFLIPEILSGLRSPDAAYFGLDMKNLWPLNYYFFHDWHFSAMLEGGNLGMFMLFLGIFGILVATPVLTYFYGKRWYCSWVCGCGGLAETAGDPFRHLSDKSMRAWKIERWMIHGVLVFVILMTAMTIYMRFTGSSRILFIDAYQLQSWYGFLIGAAFSGVIGVGFYPIMGSRVWCRFGCPMAAILGLLQRGFSRFRITTNGAQCISCGNCSTYCEMGIDVRAYAQRGQNIVRASCVGCGVCSAVCPRGVLRLENGPTEDRKAVHVRRDMVDILDPDLY